MALNKKRVSDTSTGLAFLKQFKVTNVVAGRGHDCGGLICDLHLGSKKIATFHDDGWGGQPEIRFLIDGIEAEVIKMLKDVNYAQLMFDNGWDFMKNPDRIDVNSQIEDVICLLVSLKEDEKQKKALIRDSKTSLIVGISANGYTMHFWSFKSGKKAPLDKIPTKQIQEKYDKLRKNLSKDEKILNPVEQLVSLGVKV